MFKSARLATGFALGLTTLTVVFLLFRPKPTPLSDLEFTQTAFAALMRGDSNAESSVDFENLKTPGMKHENSDDYLALQNEGKKARFRAAFITEFASEMRRFGLEVETLKNWRVTSADSTFVRVHANATNASLSLTLSQRNGKRKISEVGMYMP